MAVVFFLAACPIVPGKQKLQGVGRAVGLNVREISSAVRDRPAKEDPMNTHESKRQSLRMDVT